MLRLPADAGMREGDGNDDDDDDGENRRRNNTKSQQTYTHQIMTDILRTSGCPVWVCQTAYSLAYESTTESDTYFMRILFMCIEMAIAVRWFWSDFSLCRFVIRFSSHKRNIVLAFPLCPIGIALYRHWMSEWQRPWIVLSMCVP